MNLTLQYYADNAQEFFDNTYDKEMYLAYRKFLPLIAENSHILDAGCGSGRDSRYFLSKGYSVTAFDASEKMAELASIYIGQDVQYLTFDQVEAHETYDAIWAAASLLHLPSSELAKTFSHLSKALKKDGLFYASFKYGVDEYNKDGRHFTSLNEERTEALFDEISSLQLQMLWLSDDLRQERKGEKWLNLLARKGSE